MVEEKEPSKKEEKVLSILEEARLERSELERVRDETRQLVSELRELKADEILSGKADAGRKEPEKPAEINPREYAEQALKGLVGK